MTGSSTQGIKTVLHPVSDLATAKGVYAALLVPMLAWSFGVLFANGPLRGFLARDVFGWLPGYLLPSWEPPRPPDRALLLAALVLQLLVDGLATA